MKDTEKIPKRKGYKGSDRKGGPIKAIRLKKKHGHRKHPHKVTGKP